MAGEQQGISDEEVLSYFGRKLGEYSTQCPICQLGVMTIEEVEYDVPSLGPVMLVSKRCSRCGFRHNELVPLRTGRRTRLYLRVETPAEYRTKIVRSPYARIVILELGMSIKPGAAAQVFITNVEGLLQMFLDTLQRYEVLEGVRVDSLKRRVQELIENQSTPLTVVLDDAEGVSTFLPEPGAHPLVVIELVS